MAHCVPTSYLDAAAENARRDRLRSALPAAASLLMLLGLTMAGALAMRKLLNVAAWLVGVGG